VRQRPPPPTRGGAWATLRRLRVGPCFQRTARCSRGQMRPSQIAGAHMARAQRLLGGSSGAPPACRRSSVHSASLSAIVSAQRLPVGDSECTTPARYVLRMHSAYLSAIASAQRLLFGTSIRGTDPLSSILISRIPTIFLYSLFVCPSLLPPQRILIPPFPVTTPVRQSRLGLRSSAKAGILRLREANYMV
jgi:hypothetical protein